MEQPTVFLIIKNDAIRRGLTEDIISYLKDHLKIRRTYAITLTADQVDMLKDQEFRTKWREYPDPYIKRLVLEYEAQPVIVVECDSPPKMPFETLRMIKGNHHIPELCNHNSVRWIFRDKDQYARLFAYSQDILLDRLPDGTVVFPASVIHTPDDMDDNQRIRRILMEQAAERSW